MSCSQKQTVVTLIERKGKDRGHFWKLATISLVNVDAKIVSKVVTTRMKTVLSDIIHHSQTGIVEGRYINETVRSIFDIMALTLEEEVRGLLIFIDF